MTTTSRLARFIFVTATVVASSAACGGSDETSAEESVDSLSQGVCPGDKTVKGVDVSYYQGVIDWTKVGHTNIEFAIARVSYGAGFVDPKFKKNWKGIKAAGLVRGTYQFFIADQDPIEQADLLLDQLAAVGGLEPDDLPPTIDIETKEGVGNKVIVERLHAWLDHVEKAIGRKPIIYSSPGFWNSIGNPKGFGKYPLWVAHWGVDCPTVPSGSWKDFTIWQEGPFKVDGFEHKVDGNFFNGSKEDLLAFAKGPEGPTTTPVDSSSGDGEGGGEATTDTGEEADDAGGEPATVGDPADAGEPEESSSCSFQPASIARAEPVWLVALAVLLAWSRRRRPTSRSEVADA